MGPRKGTLESSPESSQAYSAEKILERPAERLGMPNRFWEDQVKWRRAD